MKHVLLRLLAGWIAFLACLPVQAAEAPAPVTDPAKVEAHYRQVLQQPQYQDVEETDVDSRLRDWLSAWFLKLGENVGNFKYAREMSRFASFLMTALVVLSLVGLFYVIGRVFRRRRAAEDEDQAGLPATTRHQSPAFYEREIREAIAAADWHGAWLAAWRQFLSRLESRQLVEPDRTRTNREYLAQLRARDLPSSAYPLLVEMVDTYDRFIYGRRPVKEDDWNSFQRQVNEAALVLHLDEKNHVTAARPEAA